MSFSGTQDARLVALSLREGWPMTPGKRREAIGFLEEFVADPATRPKIRAAITKILNSLDLEPSTEK